ncbi:MAG: hypothetical protein KGN79_10475 [Acidobacteriota bacterium]|nr:hypothetical protein [Acidobacteriota bacterium]
MLLVAGYNWLDRVIALLLAAWCFWDAYGGLTKGKMWFRWGMIDRSD